VPVFPQPYLKGGQRVRIMSSPLAGEEGGIFLHRRPEKGMVVLAVDLWQRSIAVEIESSVVVAA
jgi:transcription termination/antitermination protein NusG